MEYSQVERHSFLVRVFKGSNPFIPICTGNKDAAFRRTILFN